MSKKMMKRNLALGALMAFVITGQAFAGDLIGGDDLSYATKLSDETIIRQEGTTGEYDDVIGANYYGINNDTTNLHNKTTVCNLQSVTTTLGGNIEVFESVFGGSKIAGGFPDGGTAPEVEFTVNTAVTNLTIDGGNYGTIDRDKDFRKVVTAGDFVKDRGCNYVNVVKINSNIEESNLTINDGEFDAVVYGGSVIGVYTYQNVNIGTNVKESNVTINGGNFNAPVVAGGASFNLHTGGSEILGNLHEGSNITNTVETVNLTINDGEFKESIYAGGVEGVTDDAKPAIEPIASVGVANIEINNAEVKDIYGYNVIGERVITDSDDNGSYGDWNYSPNMDKSVNTNLTLTNVIAGTVDIQEGTVTLATTGDGTTEVKTLKTGTGVTVSMVADGTATDALNGDAEAFRKKITITDSYDGYESVKGLMKAGEVVGDVTFELDKQGNVKNVKEALHKGNASVNSMSNIALMAWRAETNDMNKRMGELRNANGEHGVWVRVVGGEDEYKSVEYDYTQYQLGYDEKLSTDPTWTVGMALTYTDGESKFAQGSGENEHKGVAIYGSKLNADGSFVDLIAKYSRLEHDFTRDGAKGDYSTNGYSVSAEYGKRYEQSNGLWIEPQVELTYGKVKSADYKLGSVLVNQDAMESLIGRVGFSIGKDIKQGNVYARASYLYDFEGETATTFTNGGSRQFEDDLGGDWWEVGVGANINLSKATYIYADVEKTFGGEVDTNWQWNLGVRYSF